MGRFRLLRWKAASIQSTFLCKPCLKRLENGGKVLDKLNYILSGVRQYFGCIETEIHAVPKALVGVDEDETHAHYSSRDSKKHFAKLPVGYVSIVFSQAKLKQMAS